MTVRKPLIAGNWKMNKTASEAEKLLGELIPLVASASADVAVCPPATALQASGKILAGTNIALGAQNVHFAPSGAYTGEISAQMLVELGVKFVIVGHSERRRYFGDTDETVNKRALAALNAGIIPIVCVGESLEEKTKGETLDVLRRAVTQSLDGANDFGKVVIAYEPYWAIGTGLTPTPEEIEATMAHIRTVVKEKFGPGSATRVRILYGGSVTADNAGEILSLENVDGALVGGESLKPERFAKIVQSANN